MGTEEFWVPAVIAAVGAAGQGINTMNAQKRQSNAEVQSIDDQQQYRANANSQVKALTDAISKNNPQAMAAKQTGDFIKTLRQNQGGGNPDSSFGGPTSALAPAAGASSRYKSDATTAQSGTEKYGQTYASEIANIDSAVKQRQNEGLAQQTLGTNLNLLGAESYTKNFVDQLRAQTAGQSNPWVTMFSGMLQKGAGAYASNAGGSDAGWTPTAGNSAPTADFTNTVKPKLPYG